MPRPTRLQPWPVRRRVRAMTRRCRTTAARQAQSSARSGRRPGAGRQGADPAGAAQPHGQCDQLFASRRIDHAARVDHARTGDDIVELVEEGVLPGRRKLLGWIRGAGLERRQGIEGFRRVQVCFGQAVGAFDPALAGIAAGEDEVWLARHPDGAAQGADFRGGQGTGTDAGAEEDGSAAE